LRLRGFRRFSETPLGEQRLDPRIAPRNDRYASAGGSVPPDE
jgi:hypothetical protein